MYLYRFAMQQLPFGLTPNTDLFCPLETHMEALNVVTFALQSGEALVKVVGEVGSGKTMLCRLLLNQLSANRKLAYIPNPNLTPRELKFSFAKELGLRVSDNCREDQLSQRIQTRLLNLNKTTGPVVLLVDEAQQLTPECLETIRLFTNLETEQQKLLQIVLFGQPELDMTLNDFKLRQIRQRIAFSYRLKLLNSSQVKRYVTQRLKHVTKLNISYSFMANVLLNRYSKGTPRLINILCHKALLLAFGQDRQAITFINVLHAAKDTESINTKVQDHLGKWLAVAAILASSSVMAYWSLA